VSFVPGSQIVKILHLLLGSRAEFFQFGIFKTLKNFVNFSYAHQENFGHKRLDRITKPQFQQIFLDEAMRAYGGMKYRIIITVHLSCHK
jgi:hypothetical protein